LLGCASTPGQVSFPISSAMQVRKAKPAGAHRTQGDAVSARKHPRQRASG
jgi:hypothetical protein